MKYYMVSDIHGNYRILMKLFDQLINLQEVFNKEAKLYFLGDYINGGNNSYKVLNCLYDLQQCFIEGNYDDALVVLRGNHEEAFIEFLKGENDLWISDDYEFLTTKTFLTKEQYSMLKVLAKEASIHKISTYVRKLIHKNHEKLIKWLYQLPYYYETEYQIMVHAGIDEEAEDLWKVGTPEYYFVGKYPASTGKFIKDVIAGHISSALIANDDEYLGRVFYDSYNHYFIDGSILKSKKCPVLVFNTENKEYSSFQVECNKEYKSMFYIKEKTE